MVHSTACEWLTLNTCGDQEWVLFELSTGGPSADKSNSPSIVIETITDDNDKVSIASPGKCVVGLMLLDLSNDTPDPYLCQLVSENLASLHPLSSHPDDCDLLPHGNDDLSCTTNTSKPLNLDAILSVV